MNIEETLKFLEPLYPITGAIHVGVGGPHNLNVYKTLGVEKLLLIEANQTRCEIIKKHIPEDKDWKVVNQVVADIEGEAQYYELNNKNESGLIPPEKLKPIWPNIKLVEERTETVTTLDSLVCKYTEGEVREKYNLLVIDCLSSLSILNNAKENLENIDVLIVRVMSNKNFQSDKDIENDELAKITKQNCFCLFKKYTLMPNVSKYFFFKDKLVLKNLGCIQSEIRVNRICSANPQIKHLKKKISNEKSKIKDYFKALQLEKLNDDLGKFNKNITLINKQRLNAFKSILGFSSEINELNPEANKWYVPLERKIIIVGTMPRCGSTWLYNIIRYVLFLSNQSFYSSWIKDYDKYNKSYWHVIKIHEPEPELASLADFIVTTRRDILNVGASLKRMKWSNDGAGLLKKLNDSANVQYEFWQKNSDLEIEFADITNSPEELIRIILDKLDLFLEDSAISFIARQMDNIKSPKHYNKITELHPNHRGGGESPEELLSEIDYLNITKSFEQWRSKKGYL